MQAGLRLHLHPAEISIAFLVSKQHQLGCLELGSNTATDLLRWAGGAQAVPQHQLVQDAFPHPLVEPWTPPLPPSVTPFCSPPLQPTGSSTRAAWTVCSGCCLV